ncbi:MAG: threonylcarbamoyl-AMP synthase [candidate division Zixibacteria bacterium]|nr:threonylcarbamoyl-AMP synthase [candidate division Zixibacteria bacterium]
MIVRIDPILPEKQTLEHAAAVLTAGGLVVAPTETRYGLLGRADRQDVLEKLYEVKQRSLDSPTALLIRDFDEVEQYARVNRAAIALAERFLPGPMTLVLSATCDWPPPRVVNGKIGLRWSSSPVVRALLDLVEVPVTATSANITGQPEHGCVQEIVDDFEDRVALYLDSGSLTGPVSTVIDCSEDQPRVLREGAVALEEITRIMDELHD